MKSTRELMATRDAGINAIKEIDSKLKELGIKRTLGQITTVDETIQDMAVDEFDFSDKTRKRLEKAGITTIKQLIATSTGELMRNNGDIWAIEEIEKNLRRLGIEKTPRQGIYAAGTTQDISIDELNFSVRTFNALNRGRN